MSIEIPLINSDKPAIVDDDMAHLLRYQWRIHNDGHVVRDGENGLIYMHDEVMGIKHG